MTCSPDTIEVNARGHRCPVPTLRLRRVVERAESGAAIRLIADDPMAKIDVPHYVREAGLELIASGEESGAIWFLVRKP